jgi:hypothetical protein
MLSFLPEAREGLRRAMERQILNFNIEWLEALWSVLALISAALSVYLWKRAAAVPSLPDQPAFTSAWRARLHAQAGSAAAFNSSTNHCMATTIKDSYPGLYSIERYGRQSGAIRSILRRPPMPYRRSDDAPVRRVDRNLASYVRPAPLDRSGFISLRGSRVR